MHIAYLGVSYITIVEYQISIIGHNLRVVFSCFKEEKNRSRASYVALN